MTLTPAERTWVIAAPLAFGVVGFEQLLHTGTDTQLPRLGSTEVWEIMNLTQDAHLIHLHLIQFQLLNRQQITQTTNSDGEAEYFCRAKYDSEFPGGRYSGLQKDSATWGPVNYKKGEYIAGYGSPNPYATPNADGAIGGNPAFKRSCRARSCRPRPTRSAGRTPSRCTRAS
jgi:hypothetical protein